MSQIEKALIKIALQSHEKLVRLLKYVLALNAVTLTLPAFAMDDSQFRHSDNVEDRRPDGPYFWGPSWPASSFSQPPTKILIKAGRAAREHNRVFSCPNLKPRINAFQELGSKLEKSLKSPELDTPQRKIEFISILIDAKVLKEKLNEGQAQGVLKNGAACYFVTSKLIKTLNAFLSDGEPLNLTMPTQTGTRTVSPEASQTSGTTAR